MNSIASDVSELLNRAANDLHEGLTAALPEDERGWMLRERFQAAESAVKEALATLSPPLPSLEVERLRDKPLSEQLAYHQREAHRLMQQIVGGPMGGVTTGPDGFAALSALPLDGGLSSD